MRRTVIPLALLLCVLLAPAAASARPTVGIGDQNPTAFQDSKMLKLKHLKIARLVVGWDWYKDAQAAAHARWWMSTATAAHMRPLVTFNRNWTHSGRKKIPSLTAYKKGFKAFRRQFPKVRDFSAWNEPNAKDQPFYRKPAKAAKYFNALRSACKKCTIVAGDVNDGSNMVGWLRTYKRHLHKPKVWALHNYKDSTSKHTRGTTRTFLRTVRGSVWLTETGGLTNRGGLKGQAKAVKRIFQLARSSKRIKRLYFYQWRAVRHSHWDSAFLTRTGKPRPAYYTLRFQLKRSH